jgi:nucleotide-binding universal stress UspA family protein
MTHAQESNDHPEGSGEGRYQRILVATDGSDCSVRAAAHAIYLAEALGARLYALYSVDVQRAFHVGIHFNEAVAELQKFGEEAVGAVREKAEERGIECEEILAEGAPHRSIIRVSNEIGADLIVIGSTGMTSLERALIGSESQKVLHFSERPVLLIREP